MSEQREQDYKDGKIGTASGRTPEQFDASVPNPAKLADGQFADHWVLSAEERAKGFVRPVRNSYRHLKCGTVTTMPQSIAETYAVNPKYYGSTFCAGCHGYFPVGEDGEFTWGSQGKEKVGT